MKSKQDRFERVERLRAKAQRAARVRRDRRLRERRSMSLGAPGVAWRFIGDFMAEDESDGVWS